MTATARPGEWVDHAPGLDDLVGSFNLRIPTDRYRSREYAEQERDAIWLKTWQVNKTNKAEILKRLIIFIFFCKDRTKGLFSLFFLFGFTLAGKQLL